MSISDRVRLHELTVLSDNWYTLRKARFDYRMSDGTWQEQTRESYDRGNGCVCLLYDPARRTVILIRQFRWPAFENGHDDLLIEAPAGLLDEADPAERMRAELEEETGYRIATLTPLWDAFMSPGSVTERLHFFVGRYSPDDRIDQGGGVEDEGEDIEVLELPLTEALEMIDDGRIRDAKTIMLLQHAALHLMPGAI
ncbi:NUDIX domain-containing protein [Palleronia abyssalis]|uniref:GDP-mannose pyrophosphatase n=1 Tax=Palleronia abyssalis TaxID=1501240 RepID=A0A2R8BRN4_9RHOB|nr:NUDIX domain-containing protein [Palleronia abyssalis]SPJ22820.1 GDP-mannose pyrophosphatase NudK [Palleronia abyssalis]